MTLDSCHAIFCTPPLRGRGGAPASVLHLSHLTQPRVHHPVQADAPRLFFSSRKPACVHVHGKRFTRGAEPDAASTHQTHAGHVRVPINAVPSRPSQRQCMLPLRYTWTDTSADAGKCSLAGAARSVRRDDATRIWSTPGRGGARTRVRRSWPSPLGHGRGGTDPFSSYLYADRVSLSLPCAAPRSSKFQCKWYGRDHLRLSSRLRRRD